MSLFNEIWLKKFEIRNFEFCSYCNSAIIACCNNNKETINPQLFVNLIFKKHHLNCQKCGLYILLQHKKNHQNLNSTSTNPNPKLKSDTLYICPQHYEYCLCNRCGQLYNIPKNAVNPIVYTNHNHTDAGADANEKTQTQTSHTTKKNPKIENKSESEIIEPPSQTPQPPSEYKDKDDVKTKKIEAVATGNGHTAQNKNILPRQFLFNSKENLSETVSCPATPLQKSKITTDHESKMNSKTRIRNGLDVTGKKKNNTPSIIANLLSSPISKSAHASPRFALNTIKKNEIKLSDYRNQMKQILNTTNSSKSSTERYKERDNNVKQLKDLEKNLEDELSRVRQDMLKNMEMLTNNNSQT